VRVLLAANDGAGSRRLVEDDHPQSPVRLDDVNALHLDGLELGGSLEFRAWFLLAEAGKHKHCDKSRGRPGIKCKESHVGKNLHINSPGCMTGKSVLNGKRGTVVLGFAASGICGFIFSLLFSEI